MFKQKCLGWASACFYNETTIHVGVYVGNNFFKTDIGYTNKQIIQQYCIGQMH